MYLSSGIVYVFVSHVYKKGVERVRAAASTHLPLQSRRMRRIAKETYYRGKRDLARTFPCRSCSLVGCACVRRQRPHRTQSNADEASCARTCWRRRIRRSGSSASCAGCIGYCRRSPYSSVARGCARRPRCRRNRCSGSYIYIYITYIYIHIYMYTNI